jgi:membrane protein
VNETETSKSADGPGKHLIDGLWSAGIGGASRFRRAAVTVARVGYITVEGFVQDLCLIRASALTFASLMALVPTLAIGFALLRGLGWSGARLETWILSKATILSPEAIELVVSYIDNTNFAGLGAIGGSVLLVTFISVLTNIEASFNAIWGNAAPRAFMRRIIDYCGVLVVAPILLILTTSMTAMVSGSSVFGWFSARFDVEGTADRFVGYGIYGVVWLLFAFLYVYIPNTRVRIVPALIGGIIAGSVWQLTQWAYIRFQVGMANYNAIYGAMAQLPVLMMWFYVSWVIVLFGAEIAFAVQNLRSYSLDRRAREAKGQAMREFVGLSVVRELARAASGRTEAPGIDALGASLDLPGRTVRDVVGELAKAGLIHTSEQNAGACYLSLAPSEVPVTRVLEVLRGRAPDGPRSGDGEGAARIQVLLREAAAAQGRALSHLTLADLAGPAPGAARQRSDA